MPAGQTRRLSTNALRLGVFGANCSSGRSYTTLPERWEASWEHNRRLAHLTEEVGIECMIPIARWKGYGGSTNPNGANFETLAWACGVLAVTQRLTAFCTVHVPLHHPLVAAKQMATADHIGQGRLGVNLVCGWSVDEFRMFGVTPQAHDARYAQGAEWWEIITRLWAGDGPFDYPGTYYQLQGVEGAPSPYGISPPLMMNAGSSPAGRQFAIAHSDLHFDAVTTLAASRERLEDTRRQARERGRSLQIWTPVGVICRPTQGEAEAYLRRVVAHADWGAIGYLTDIQARDGRGPTALTSTGEPGGVDRVGRRVLARGAYCVVGDPDTVARELGELHAVGFDGLGLNFVDYLAELPYFAATVLPRLEAQGLRAPVLSAV